mmetsp:Transcript_35127/g.113748  ORF Transcript_35127/g.113748 Transcript_35127/m.113748 type:complete len:235 (+) Transcript_35127:1175-1879(+)
MSASESTRRGEPATSPQSQPSKGVMKRSSRTTARRRRPPPKPTAAAQRLTRKSPMHRRRSAAVFSSSCRVLASKTKCSPKSLESSCSKQCTRGAYLGRRQFDANTTCVGPCWRAPMMISANRLRRGTAICSCPLQANSAKVLSVDSGLSVLAITESTFSKAPRSAWSPLLWSGTSAALCSAYRQFVSLNISGPCFPSLTPTFSTPSTSTKMTVSKLGGISMASPLGKGLGRCIG